MAGHPVDCCNGTDTTAEALGEKCDCFKDAS